MSREFFEGLWIAVFVIMVAGCIYLAGSDYGVYLCLRQLTPSCQGRIMPEVPDGQ